eukprot:COSAG01_NODE_28968_length_648_cov_1.081967_2_plen_45_part_00
MDHAGLAHDFHTSGVLELTDPEFGINTFFSKLEKQNSIARELAG